jgi:hypothetical protein
MMGGTAQITSSYKLQPGANLIKLLRVKSHTVNAIKLISSSLTVETNKLECLSLQVIKISPIFAGKARAQSYKTFYLHHLRMFAISKCLSLGCLSILIYVGVARSLT